MCQTYRDIYSCNHFEWQTEFCDYVKNSNAANVLANPRAGTGCTSSRGQDKHHALKCEDCHKEWKQDQCNKWDEMWTNYLFPMAEARQDLRTAARQMLRAKLDTKKNAKEAKLATKLFPRWTKRTKRGKRNGIYEAFPAEIEKQKARMARYIARWPKKSKGGSKKHGSESDSSDSGSSCSSDGESSKSSKRAGSSSKHQDHRGSRSHRDNHPRYHGHSSGYIKSPAGWI